MILIPHYVGASPIAGAGLFTAVDIAEGTPIYRVDFRFLQIISDGEIAGWPQTVQDATRKYCYRGRGASRLQGAVYFCADDSRFMNHDDAPNTLAIDDGDVYVAARRIPAHSEITCDYRGFCEPGDLCFEFLK